MKRVLLLAILLVGSVPFVGPLLLTTSGQGVVVVRRISAGATPTPSPTPLMSGLIAWTEGRFEAYSNGADACTWHDQSGNANDFVTSAPNCMTFATGSLNGHPSFRQGGGNTYATLPNIMSALTEATIMIIVKVDADCSYNGLWDFSAADFGQTFPYSDCVIYENWGTTVRKTYGDPTPALDSYVVYTVWSKASDWGAQINDGTPVTSGSNTVTFKTAPLIGVESNGGKPLEGNVVAVLIYNTKLTSGNITTNLNYFDAIYNVIP